MYQGISKQLFDEASSSEEEIRNNKNEAGMGSGNSQSKTRSDYQYALDESAYVTTTDAAGIITYANDRFCELSEYSREELIGQNHRTINSGFHPKALFQDLWATVMSGKVWRGEIKNKAKDGTYFWCDTTVVPFLNKEGIPFQFTAIRKDITKRKDAETRLRKISRLYKFISNVNQMIVRTTSVGVLFSEVCTIATHIGKFKMAWIGIADENSRTINLAAGSGTTDSDIRKFSTYSYDINGVIEKVLNGEKYCVVNDVQNEVGITWKEHGEQQGFNSVIILPVKKLNRVIGTFSLCSSEINFFDKDEIRMLLEAAGDLSFALDVIEKEKLRIHSEENLLRSEARLKEAQALSHVSNWEIDLVTGINTWSDEFYNIFGIKKGEITPSPEAFAALIHPEDAEYVKEIIETTFRTFANSGFYAKAKTSDDSVQHIYSKWEFEFDRNNNPIRLFGTLQDVTQRKKTEEKLIQSETRFREMFESAPEGIIIFDIRTMSFIKCNEKA
jgi:PAS domain S-box-containing protein